MPAARGAAELRRRTGDPLWLICPYDADNLPDDVLTEARRCHPVVVEDVAPTESCYAGHGHIATLFAADLSPADPGVPVRDFQRGQLAAVRAEVESRAASAGLRSDQGQDLALAVHEVAVNSVEHGGGSGEIRVWRRTGALVVEVRDAGQIADPLVGRQLPSWDDESEVAGSGWPTSCATWCRSAPGPPAPSSGSTPGCSSSSPRRYGPPGR